MEGGVRENTFEQTAAQWDVYRDIFAPPPPRPRSKPWERAPISAHAPRLHGQKIWKKAGLRQQPHALSKENEDAAQLELERGGVGARKRARMLGAKENITDAPWQSVSDADDVKLPKNESGSPSKTNIQNLSTCSPEKLQVVPRKRTNANHLITPRKSGRRAPLREISTPMVTTQTPQKSPQKLLLDVTISAAPECLESPRKCSSNDTMTKLNSPEKPVRRRKSLRKSTRRLTTNNVVEVQPTTTSEASPPQSSFAPSISAVQATPSLTIPLMNVASSQTPAQQLEPVVPFPHHADADATFEESLLPIESPSICDEVKPSLEPVVMNDESHLLSTNSPSNDPPHAIKISSQYRQQAYEAAQLQIQETKTSIPDFNDETTLSSTPTEVCHTPRQKRRASSQRPSTRRSQRTINRTATLDSEACKNPLIISREENSHIEVVPAAQTGNTSELSVSRNITSDNILDIPSSEIAEQISDTGSAAPGLQGFHTSSEKVVDPSKIDVNEIKPDTSNSLEVATNASPLRSPTILESHFLLQAPSDAAAQADNVDPALVSLSVAQPTASGNNEGVVTPGSEPSREDACVPVAQINESLLDNKVILPLKSESVVFIDRQASPASVFKVDVESLAIESVTKDLEHFDPVPIASVTRSISDNIATETEALPETSTPHPSSTELVEAISENAPATSYDHDDTDLLRSFLMRVKANKETKAKETSVSKRKRSFPHSPIKLPLGGEEGTFSPSPPLKDEFDISLPAPSPMKRRKRNEASGDDVETPKSIRRSGRTRLPIKSAVAAPSFIPVRRLGQEGDNTVTLRRSEEKELAALTRVNTRKNKGVALSPLELLAKQAEEKDDPALRQKALKEKFDQKTQVQASKKAKTVVWAEELAQYQTADGKRALTEKVDDRAKEKAVGVDDKKGAVKVGVRSSRVSLGMAVNGTPAPKRKVKARS